MKAFKNMLENTEEYQNYLKYKEERMNKIKELQNDYVQTDEVKTKKRLNRQITRILQELESLKYKYSSDEIFGEVEYDNLTDNQKLDYIYSEIEKSGEIKIFGNLTIKEIKKLRSRYRAEAFYEWNFKLMRDSETNLRTNAFLMGFYEAQAQGATQNLVITKLSAMQATQAV